MSRWKRSSKTRRNTHRQQGQLRAVVRSDPTLPNNNQLGIFTVAIYVDHEFLTKGEAQQFADDMLDTLEEASLSYVEED